MLLKVLCILLYRHQSRTRATLYEVYHWPSCHQRDCHEQKKKKNAMSLIWFTCEKTVAGSWFGSPTSTQCLQPNRRGIIVETSTDWAASSTTSTSKGVVLSMQGSPDELRVLNTRWASSYAWHIQRRIKSIYTCGWDARNVLDRQTKRFVINSSSSSSSGERATIHY